VLHIWVIRALVAWAHFRNWRLDKDSEEGGRGIFRRSCYPDISLDTEVIQNDYQSV